LSVHLLLARRAAAGLVFDQSLWQERFKLVVNLNAAKALGITIPRSLLLCGTT
jgi:hypothetical protein